MGDVREAVLVAVPRGGHERRIFVTKDEVVFERVEGSVGLVLPLAESMVHLGVEGGQGHHETGPKSRNAIGVPLCSNQHILDRIFIHLASREMQEGVEGERDHPLVSWLFFYAKKLGKTFKPRQGISSCGIETDQLHIFSLVRRGRSRVAHNLSMTKSQGKEETRGCCW